MRPFAAAMFLGAFLLFLAQPLAGKYVLPWFGGGPAVWTAWNDGAGRLEQGARHGDARSGRPRRG